MHVRIYQINPDRDTNRVKFEGYSEIERYQGSFDIESNIYDMVFDGDVECKNLEEVFAKFNMERPEGHKGHSLSVSDIVEVVSGEYEPGFYYCDRIGFVKVEFEADKAAVIEEEKIKVVICEPGWIARIEEIPNSLESLQKVVGGYIEAVYPFDDEACIICNEEGKITGMDLNRALRNEDDEVADIIAGTFIVCGLGEDDFCGLTDEQVERYMKMFEYPEAFFNVNGNIVVKKVFFVANG